MRLPPNYEYAADSAESVHVARALTQVEAAGYQTEFPPLESEKYIPVDRSDDPGAKFTTYRMYTRTGIAKLVTSRGQDLPTAKVYVKEYHRQYYNLGCSYEYTLDDLRGAQFSSQNGGPALNLDMEHAAAAREAIARGFDAVGAIGSATSSTIPGLSVGIGVDVGMLGLLNQTNASTYTPATGVAGSTAWSLKTPDEKLADLVGMYAAMESTTYKVFTPTTFLLPVTQFRNAAGRRMGDGSDESVISIFRKMFPGVAIDSWNYCQGAGTNGADRVVAFVNDARRVKFKISEEFNQLPPQYDNLEFSVDCIGRTAGVVSMYPISIMYMDGI